MEKREWKGRDKLGHAAPSNTNKQRRNVMQRDTRNETASSLGHVTYFEAGAVFLRVEVPRGGKRRGQAASQAKQSPTISINKVQTRFIIKERNPRSVI